MTHISRDGYRVHCRAREHIVIAERALGKALPPGAMVHHVNGIRTDNRPENLVICPNQAYHMLLHRRQEARALGFPCDFRKCAYCKQYDHPSNLAERRCGGVRQGWQHNACNSEREIARYHRIRGSVRPPDGKRASGKRVHVCDACGKRCLGNGGSSSHRRACAARAKAEERA